MVPDVSIAAQCVVFIRDLEQESELVDFHLCVEDLLCLVLFQELLFHGINQHALTHLMLVLIIVKKGNLELEGRCLLSQNFLMKLLVICKVLSVIGLIIGRLELLVRFLFVPDFHQSVCLILVRAVMFHFHGLSELLLMVGVRSFCKLLLRIEVVPNLKMHS